MSTLLKFRPFAAQCRRYTPNILSALTNDATWWYDEPVWTKSSSRNSLDSGNNFGELIDNDKVWKLSYDLPGIKAKDLSVTIDGNNVQISASRNLTSLSGDSKTVKKARIFKSFPVTSNNVDLSQLKANLSDGVLVISAPKKESSDVKEITITTEPHSEDPALLDDGEDIEQLVIEEATLEEELENITINDSNKSSTKASKK
jgi:HSP20 family molecular chaperone IbpA